MVAQAGKELLDKVEQLALGTFPSGLYPWDLGVHSMRTGKPSIVYQEPAQIIDHENRLLKIKPSPLSLLLACESLNLSRGSNTFEIHELNQNLDKQILLKAKAEGWLEHNNDIELDSSDLGWRISKIIAESPTKYAETRNFLESRDKYDFLSSRQYEACALNTFVKEHVQSFCHTNALDNRQSNLALSLSLQMFSQQYGICLEPKDNSFLVSTWQRDFAIRPGAASESFQAGVRVGVLACESLVELFRKSIQKEYTISEFTKDSAKTTTETQVAKDDVQEFSQ